MIDFETAYPSVSRPQLYTYLHEQGIPGQMLAVVKSLTKSLKVRVLHPHIPPDDYVDIERGLAEGSALSPKTLRDLPRESVANIETELPERAMRRVAVDRRPSLCRRPISLR